jgi:hypothetical protein
VSEALPSLLPTQAQNPLAEQIRDKGAEVVLAIYRFAKNVLLHAIGNDAVVSAATQAVETLQAFSAEVGTGASVTFTEDTIFVCGQLLRASRGVYESATELGRMLGRLEVSEVGFELGVDARALYAFGEAFALATRDPERKDALLTANIPGVTVRKAEPQLTMRRRDDDLPEHERAVRFYATALVVMRQFFEDVAAGHTLLPHRVKRLAQRMVILAESQNPALLGITAMAAAHRDDAGRAVQSALLAVLLGRALTRNRIALSRLGMAALMADVGSARIVGRQTSGTLMGLADDERARIPAASALVCIASGERAPTLHTEVLTLARRLVDHLAPRDTRAALSPPDAMEALAQDPSVSRVLLRVLTRTIGLFPAGTVVELEGGAWAVVLGPSARPEAFPAPKISLVTDARGRAVDTPEVIDLGAPAPGTTVPRIARVLAAGEARFNVARTFFG